MQPKYLTLHLSVECQVGAAGLAPGSFTKEVIEKMTEVNAPVRHVKGTVESKACELNGTVGAVGMRLNSVYSGLWCSFVTAFVRGCLGSRHGHIIINMHTRIHTRMHRCLIGICWSSL